MENEQLQRKPDSHMAEAILVTIFAFLPFGVVAIIYAAKVGRLWAAGDFAGAENASRKAYIWVRCSVWVLILLGLLVVARNSGYLFSAPAQ